MASAGLVTNPVTPSPVPGAQPFNTLELAYLGSGALRLFKLRECRRP